MIVNEALVKIDNLEIKLNVRKELEIQYTSSTLNIMEVKTVSELITKINWYSSKFGVSYWTKVYEIYLHKELQQEKEDLTKNTINPKLVRNSVEWWLRRIVDPEIREKALKNTSKSNLNKLVSSLHTAMINMCGWTDSPEGVEYWATVDAKLLSGELKVFFQPVYDKEPILTNNQNQNQNKNGHINVSRAVTTVRQGKRESGHSISCRSKRVILETGHRCNQATSSH